MQKFVTANDEATKKKKERDLLSSNPLKYSRRLWTRKIILNNARTFPKVARFERVTFFKNY